MPAFLLWRYSGRNLFDRCIRIEDVIIYGDPDLFINSTGLFYLSILPRPTPISGEHGSFFIKRFTEMALFNVKIVNLDQILCVTQS